ncbi:MAG: hypothetical protein KDC95_10750 [Planctomycetes bacterium]|nr:hypothetical protein [Planctomycetota bacterium]
MKCRTLVPKRFLLPLALLTLGTTWLPTRAMAQQDDVVVGEQRVLLERAERLRSMMTRLRERYVKEDQKYYVGLLDEALTWLEKSGVTQAMNEAGAALERKLTSKALEAQQRVVGDLEKLLAILMDRRSVEDLEKDADRVEKQIQDLGRLQSKERRIRDRINELREQARTEAEKKLTKELETLASRQERLASDNAGKSSPLQDQLEQTLNEVRQLRDLEQRLEASLTSGNENSAALQQRLESLRALTDSVESHVTELRQQTKIEEAGRELDKAAERLDQVGSTSQDMEVAAERVRKAADRIAPRGANQDGKAPMDEGQRAAFEALQEAAEDLASAARDIPRANGNDTPLDDATKERAKQALAGARSRFEKARQDVGKASSERARAEAQAARDLGKEISEASQQSASAESPEAANRQNDEATAKDLERAADNLGAVAEEGQNATKGDPDAARKAESKAQAALRNLIQALTRQNAALERPSSLAQRAATAAQRSAQDLAAAAGNHESARDAADEIAKAAEAMERAARALHEREQRGSGNSTSGGGEQQGGQQEGGQQQGGQQQSGQQQGGQQQGGQQQSGQQQSGQQQSGQQQSGQQQSGQQQPQDPAQAAAERAEAARATQQDREQAREQLAKAEQRLQKAVDEYRARESRNVMDAVERQAAVERDLDALKEAIRESANAGELDAEQQQAAAKDIDSAKKAMQRASEQLAKGSPRSASRSQSEAADSLRRASQSMRQNRKLGAEEQQQMQELADRQRKLDEEILELARRIDREKNRNARTKLEQAAEAGRQAEEELAQGDPETSEQTTSEVERKLEEARRELDEERDRYRRLRQEELLFRITDEIEQLITKQTAVHGETKTIADSLGDRERLPRKLRSQVRMLGTQEGELGARARFLADSLKNEAVIVFSYSLDALAADFDELKTRMTTSSPTIDLDLLTLQKDVLERLAMLKSALTEELERKKQDRQQGDQGGNQQDEPKNTNEGDRKQPLVPDAAELKMLKRLEIDARQRIEGFVALRKTMPGELDSWAQRSLERLAMRHSKLTELLVEFLKRRGLDGSGNPEGHGKQGEDSGESTDPKKEGK